MNNYTYMNIFSQGLRKQGKIENKQTTKKKPWTKKNRKDKFILSESLSAPTHVEPGEMKGKSASLPTATQLCPNKCKCWAWNCSWRSMPTLLSWDDYSFMPSLYKSNYQVYKGEAGWSSDKIIPKSQGRPPADSAISVCLSSQQVHQWLKWDRLFEISWWPRRWKHF